MSAIAKLIDELGGIAVETQPQKVRRKSRDFYWYSPILKRQLDHVTADAVVTPEDEAEVIEVVAACYRHKIPLTARGGGTGNFGQAMPLAGGIMLDLSEVNRIKEISLGRVRVEAGAKLADIDEQCRSQGRQELRLHPSTHKTATIGGYIAGGSFGVGSITWGMLCHPGNILAARVVTMEAEPRVLELRGPDIAKVHRAYGTNGIIAVLEMPLAPAYRWCEVVMVFNHFMDAASFADAIGRQDALLKKLVTVIASPVGHAYLRPDLVGRSESMVILMIADHAMDAFEGLAGASDGRIVLERFADEAGGSDIPIFEMTWNHTTLHALKYDRSITYLQCLFPPPGHLAKVEAMHRHFGDEVPIHLEFVRIAGEITCFGLQLVRYTTDERLNEIIDFHNRSGCSIFNPHDYTLEGGGMKRVDQTQLDFKRQIDPLGLLNPGKMISWDNPNPDHDHSGDR